MEISKSTLRIGDFTEVVETRKAIKLTITVYYSERMQIKISKWKRHMGEVQVTSTSFQLFPSCIITQAVLNSSSTDMSWHMQNVHNLGHVSMEPPHN